MIWQYSNNQSVELKSDIKLGYIDANNLVPFGLILNELVSNSLEYGIEENGVISVKIQEDLDQVFLITVTLELDSKKIMWKVSVPN